MGCAHLSHSWRRLGRCKKPSGFRCEGSVGTQDKVTFGPRGDRVGVFA